MTIYLLQSCVMVVMIKAYVYYQLSLPKVVFVVAMIIGTAFICATIDQFLDKYLSFLKGKY